MTQVVAASPVRPLPSGTPAVTPSQPRTIVVGEKAELPLSVLSYNAGAMSDSRDLKQSGLLRKLRLLFTGTLNIVMGTGTAVWTNPGVFGLWGYPLLASSGQSPIVDASAYMQWIINLCRRRDFDPISVFYANSVTSSQIYAQPALANGNNAVAAYLEQFPELDPSSFVGLLNVQEPGPARVQLTVKNWGNIADGVTLAGGATATMTGQMAVQQQVYEVPLLDPNTQTLPPLNLIHRYRTKRVAINSVGTDVEIALDAGPTYTRFYIRQVINGAQDSLNLQKIAYVYGLGKAQITRDLPNQLAYQRDYFERDLPTGIFVIPFDPQDVIRSLDVAAPTLVMRINPNAVLGTGNNYWEIVTEEIIQLG